jgi:hypothetical protein
VTQGKTVEEVCLRRRPLPRSIGDVDRKRLPMPARIPPKRLPALLIACKRISTAARFSAKKSSSGRASARAFARNARAKRE